MAHPAPPRVTIGAGTHLDVHAAHAGDQLGRRLATVSIPTTPAGYQGLLAWARGLGEVEAFGIEGTGSYGAALARFLRAHRQVVLEGNRPDRQARRRRGKSDPLDAEAAARAVQAGEATVVPKAADGVVEMLRCLRVARSTAVKARTQASNAIKALVVTAPPELREQLRGLQTATLVPTAAAFPPGKPTTPAAAATLALRLLAMRHQALSAEITTLDSDLERLTTKAAPGLVALFGVGPASAGACRPPPATTPTGCARKACFAMRCGACPVEASSGTAVRHRRNRGGDRQANAALHRIVVVRLRWHQPTKDDLARRLAEGKTTKEVIRCLKRYVAREVFAALNQMGKDNLTKAA